MIKQLDESGLIDLAASLALSARPGDVVALSGPLGAGKSTFARAFLRARARDPRLEVPSPSFTLVQTYDLPGGMVWHYDLWRIETPASVAELGFDAAADAIMLVEWAERAGDFLPPGTLHIGFAFADTPQMRRITLACDARWLDRL